MKEKRGQIPTSSESLCEAELFLKTPQTVALGTKNSVLLAVKTPSERTETVLSWLDALLLSPPPPLAQSKSQVIPRENQKTAFLEQCVSSSGFTHFEVFNENILNKTIENISPPQIKSSKDQL